MASNARTSEFSRFRACAMKTDQSVGKTFEDRQNILDSVTCYCKGAANDLSISNGRFSTKRRALDCSISESATHIFGPEYRIGGVRHDMARSLLLGATPHLV